MSKVVHIGDLFEFRKGKKPGDLLDACPDGGIRFLQINHLRGKGPDVFVAEPKGTIANKSDICIVWDGANAGLVGYGLEGLIGSTITRLRAVNENLLHIPYVAKFLQSKFEYLNSTAQGAAIPHVDGVNLKQLKIPLPPLNEQKRIAAILDKVDALCRKRERAIALTDDLLRSVFLDMFGNPVTNPKGWDKKQLIEVAIDDKRAIVDGPFGASLKTDEYVETGIPVIRISNIREEGFLDKNFKFITEEKYKELIRSKVKKNDLLVARVGHTIGKACLFDKDYDALLSTTGVCKVTCNPNIMLPSFLLAFWNTNIFQSYLMTMVRGAAQPYFNLTTIKAIEVIVPPIDKQKAFIKYVKKCSKLGCKHYLFQSEVDELFHSLTQRAFRGELTAQKEAA